MKNLTSVAERFESNFEAATMSNSKLEYNPAWANGTGYFNGAVSGPNAVVMGEEVFATSIDNKGRKMLFINTKKGPIVIFERYSNKVATEQIYVWNANRATEEMLNMDHTCLNNDTMSHIFEFAN